MTALGRGTPWADKAGYVTGSLAMDDLIAASGASYRALTNPSFMDNTVRQVPSIKNQGMFFSPIAGDRKLSGRQFLLEFQILRRKGTGILSDAFRP